MLRFIAFGSRGGKNPHHLRFSNKGDVVSALDRHAIQIDTGTNNPIQAHKFDKFKIQGTFRVGEDNTMGVSNHPNETTIQQQQRQQQQKIVLMNKSNSYKPYKELVLNVRTNKLNSIIQNGINQKDYNNIKEMLEEKQEITIKNNDIKIKKI